MGIIDAFWQHVREILANRGELGVAAVLVIAGIARAFAQVLATGPAELARAAGGSQPGDSNAVAYLAVMATRSERDHGAHHLMAGDDRKGHRFQVPFDNVQVCATGRAAVNPDQHLAGTRFRVGQLLELERCGVDRRVLAEDGGSHDKTIGTPSPHASIRI